MKIRQIIGGVLLLIAAGACKNDDFVWGDEDFIRITGPEIWTLGTDSLNFTFSAFPDATTYTMETELTVQGRTADYDRTIRLQINKAKTTASATDYEFPSEVILKAGESSAKFSIVLHRTEAMQRNDARLCVEIAPSSDLLPGVNAFSSLTLAWNDKVTKPANWDDLEEFFGTYSEVKYRFIISVLNVTLFPYGESSEVTWGVMYNYKLKMRTALEAYNANPANTPMTDENGAVISFPN